MAVECVREPARLGGFGLRAAEDTRMPAFYAAAAQSVRFIAQHGTMTEALGWSQEVCSLRDLANPLADELADVEETLSFYGCSRQTVSSERQQKGRAVLPTAQALLGPTLAGGEFVPILSQRSVMQSFMPAYVKQRTSCLKPTEDQIRIQKGRCTYEVVGHAQSVC